MRRFSLAIVATLLKSRPPMMVMVHGIPPPEEEGPTAGQPVRQSVQPSPTGAPLTSATNLSAWHAVVTSHTSHDPSHPPSESIPPPEPPDMPCCTDSSTKACATTSCSVHQCLDHTYIDSREGRGKEAGCTRKSSCYQ